VNFFYRKSFQIALWLTTAIGSFSIMVLLVAAMWGGRFVFGETHHKQPVDLVWGVIVSGLFSFVCIVQLGKILYERGPQRTHGSPGSHPSRKGDRK